jgi:hypothetical protein
MVEKYAFNEITVDVLMLDATVILLSKVTNGDETYIASKPLSSKVDAYNVTVCDGSNVAGIGLMLEMESEYVFRSIIELRS